ncbi:sigma-70 family RNA polymerase sigma factor [Marinobacteraceae bacterium S3BR75-40.1]
MDSAERQLVEGLRARQESAYARAVREYSGAMLGAAAAFVDRATAEDVVQEAWLAVVDAIDGFQGRSSLKTWLCTIVANRARNRLRSQKRESSLEALDEALDGTLKDRFNKRGHWSEPPTTWNDEVQEMLENEVLKDCLDKHIQRLPETQRSILMLRELQQFGAEDVCNMLGISHANLRTGLHRARQRIMGMVDHFQETGEC